MNKFTLLTHLTTKNINYYAYLEGKKNRRIVFLYFFGQPVLRLQQQQYTYLFESWLGFLEYSLFGRAGKGSFYWILIWMTWSKHRFFWWNQLVDLCSFLFSVFQSLLMFVCFEWVLNWHFSFIDANEYRDIFST